MPTPRSLLRDELTRQLVPALQALGFTGPSAITGNRLLHEFRRPADAGTHTVTLQLEKYGLPRFILMLCIEPPEGFDHLVANGGTVAQGRLQPRPGATTRCWFRTDAGPLQRVRGRSGPAPAVVVAQCVALLPEVEAWWRDQAPSPHVSVLTHTFPGQREASGGR
jgi:hypothetical protein